MPVFNGDVVFLDASGQVRASNGDLSLRGDDTGLRSIIIGSGVALRPDRNLFLELGRPDLRWLSLYTGHLFANSGWLRMDPLEGTPNMQFGEAGFVFTGDGVNGVSFFDMEVAMGNVHLNLGGNSDLTVEGDTNLLGGATVIGGLISNTIFPSLDVTDGIDTYVGNQEFRYASMAANSGCFNMLAAPTSGTFIGVDDADILPLLNSRRALGSLNQRWVRVHATSGIFNTIGAPASGTFVEAAASIIPNRHQIYALGSNTQRWLDVFTRTITVQTVDADTVNAVAANIDDLIVNNDAFIANDLTVDNDITGNSRLTIAGTTELNGGVNANAGLGVTGGLTTDTFQASSASVFQSTVAITGTLTTRNIVPQTDRLYAIGTSALRYSRMHAASGVFNTLAPSTSGTYVTSIGSIIPERTALYSLGTSALAWGNLFATSGTITTLTGGDITATSSVVSLGTVTALGLALFNGGVFFGNAAAPSTDASTSFGLQGFRWATVYGVSGMFETIGPLPSGGFLTVNGSILPDRDLLRSLGTNGTGSRRWAIVHAGSGAFTTAATIKGAPVVTNKDAVTTVHAVVTANSGAIVNSTGEVDIYNYTVPANTLSASGKLQLECIGSVTNMTAGAVNYTPRIYINGTAIWGDLFGVSAGPRAADFGLFADICSLGSLTGQRVRGSVELSTRTAGSITGNGDFGALNGGQGNWSSVATSGTVSFASPVNIRVSMQMGTGSTNASYSGFHCILTHTPFPGA